jgi:hypothetical protein
VKGAEGGEGKEGGKLIPGPGNGADLPGRYSWQQTLRDVTISVPLPTGVKTKDVVCSSEGGKIVFGVRGQTPVVDGALPAKVVEDDTLWTLEDAAGGDGRVLTITLTKEYQMEWWSRIAENEPEIDTGKVEPENSKLTDLDESTRTTVEKLMFDSRQKALGQPTSDEIQKKRMLERFMAAHPEMDFSGAKIA